MRASWVSTLVEAFTIQKSHGVAAAMWVKSNMDMLSTVTDAERIAACVQLSDGALDARIDEVASLSAQTNIGQSILADKVSKLSRNIVPKIVKERLEELGDDIITNDFIHETLKVVTEVGKKIGGKDVPSAE